MKLLPSCGPKRSTVKQYSSLCRVNHLILSHRRTSSRCFASDLPNQHRDVTRKNNDSLKKQHAYPHLYQGPGLNEFINPQPLNDESL